MTASSMNKDGRAIFRLGIGHGVLQKAHIMAVSVYQKM